MQELPVPKFRIGDTVFCASAMSTTTKLPCPDCAGSRKWILTTPAGGSHEIACQRCNVSYAYLPALTIPDATPSVSRLTIGSVRIDTAARDCDGGSVSYMCVETGVGSGSIYDERKLFSAEDEALAAAQLMAADIRGRQQSQKHVTAIKDLSLLTFDLAAEKTERDRRISAEVSLGMLLEDIRELEPWGRSPEERDAVERIKSDLLRRFDQDAAA